MEGDHANSLVYNRASRYNSGRFFNLILPAGFQGTTEDLIVQLNAEQTLTKSGNCWVLE